MLLADVSTECGLAEKPVEMGIQRCSIDIEAVIVLTLYCSRTAFDKLIMVDVTMSIERGTDDEGS